MMRRFLAILLISAFAVIVPHIAFALTPQQVNQIAAQVTVLIDGYQPGSGVIFQRNGNVYSVLTAKHVVNVDEIYYVITPEGERHRTEATNIQLINDMDLAVVQFTSDKVYQVAQLGNSDKVPKGSTVYVAGAPEANETIPQRTLIVNPGTLVGVQPPQDGYALIYNNITQPGMSGGPVLNEEGQVIGIHGQGDRRDGSKSGLNLAIPINLFLNLNLKNDSLPNTYLPNFFLLALIHIIGITVLILLIGMTSIYVKTKNLELSFKTIIKIKKSLLWEIFFAICVVYFGGIVGISLKAGDYHNQGKYQNAIAFCEQIIRINPSFPDSYNCRGKAYYALGEKQKSIVDYNQAIQLSHGNYDAYNNRGLTYSDLGDKQKAIADYSQVIQINPNSVIAYKNRALAYSNLGDKKNAIQDFQKAAELYAQQGMITNHQDALNQIKKLQSSDKQ